MNIDSMVRFRGIIFLLVVLVTVTMAGCFGLSLTIDKHSIQTPNGERLKFYIAKKPSNQVNNKILVMLQGSGRESVTNRFGTGAEASLIGFDVLHIEKYAFNDEKLFAKTNCRERRIEDTVTVVNHVITKLYDSKVKELVIIADSEGGSIAPEIALKLNKVTHLIILGAGGLSQSQEFEMLFKKGINNNEIGIQNPETLQAIFQEIKDDPSPEKIWLGQTYKYWNSYLWYSPEVYISQLDIPTLFIIGKNDTSVPPETVEYLIPKLKDKQNFEFHIVPDLDHSFCDTNGNRQFDKILKNIILPWYKKMAIDLDPKYDDVIQKLQQKNK